MLNCLPGNKLRSFYCFEVAPKYCILDYFVDYEGNSISSKGFLPTVVDTMIISELTSPILIHFGSLIPKMSKFTLAILLEHNQFTFIHRPNIPDSYAIWFFIASLS